MVFKSDQGLAVGGDRSAPGFGSFFEIDHCFPHAGPHFIDLIMSQPQTRSKLCQMPVLPQGNTPAGGNRDAEIIIIILDRLHVSAVKLVVTTIVAVGNTIRCSPCIRFKLFRKRHKQVYRVHGDEIVPEQDGIMQGCNSRWWRGFHPSTAFEGVVNRINPVACFADHIHDDLRICRTTHITCVSNVMKLVTDREIVHRAPAKLLQAQWRGRFPG